MQLRSGNVHAGPDKSKTDIRGVARVSCSEEALTQRLFNKLGVRMCCSGGLKVTPN